MDGMNATGMRVHVYSQCNHKEHKTQWKKGYRMKEASAQVQHATKDFCIAPRLAESGARSMDGLITMVGLMKEPSTQVQHATNDFCIAPRLAESGAHSMDGLITMDGLMKEPCAQVQHATNDFCIAPRLAEFGAHSMDTSFSRHFPIIASPTRVWEWIISTQKTTFV